MTPSDLAWIHGAVFYQTGTEAVPAPAPAANQQRGGEKSVSVTFGGRRCRDERLFEGCRLLMSKELPAAASAGPFTRLHPRRRRLLLMVGAS